MVKINYLHRKVAFFIIILFNASCLTKQDALIISGEGKDPIVQFRAIFVADAPAEIHSKIIRFNKSIELSGEIQYILDNHLGNSDTIYQDTKSTREYFIFKKIQIKEGSSYTLKGVYKDDVFEKSFYIPLKLQNIQMVQENNTEYSKTIKINSTSYNPNAEKIHLFAPIERLYSPSKGKSSSIYIKDPNMTSNPDKVGIGFIKTQNTSLLKLRTNVFECPPKKNLAHKYSIIYPKNHHGGRVYINPSNNEISEDILHQSIYKSLTSSQQVIDSFRYKFLLCNDQSIEIVENFPENTKGENGEPIFNNIRPFKLNINSSFFKGYCIGLTLQIAPHLLITDYTKKICKITLYNKQNKPENTNIIALSLSFNEKSINGSREYLSLYRYNYLTERNIKKLEEKEALLLLSIYGSIKDTNTGNNYILDLPDFKSNKDLIHYLRTTKEIKAYEK